MLSSIVPSAFDLDLAQISFYATRNPQDPLRYDIK